MKASTNILFTGKLRTAADGITLQQGDFQVLKNMRYGENYPRSIAGMTKINTTATGEISIKNGFHFNKANESHVLAWANGKVYKNDTVIPNAGDFTATAIFTDTAGAGTGRFSLAPDGAMIYCNGKETKIWGGNEFRCARFFVYNSATTYTDYTEKVLNNLTTEYATISQDIIYIASTRPISSIKFYIGTANTTAGTCTVTYWNGTAYAAVTNFSDGTLVTGKSLAQTGIMSFDSTESVAKAKIEFSAYAYWYKLTFTAMNNATTVYYTMLSAPVEVVTDLWDGILRNIGQFFKGNPIIDLTNNVKNLDYVSGSTLTYADISALPISNDLVLGFTEPICGMQIIFPDGKVNTTAATDIEVSYYDGSGATFAILTVVDGTDTGTISFNQSGFIIWEPPTTITPYKFDGFTHLYFYGIQFNKILSANVYIDQILGIPAQDNPKDYKFPILWNNRTVLCNNQSKDKNKILISAANTNCVFNGYDSATIAFGDNTDILAATDIYIRDTSIYSNLLVLKQNEVWLVDGTVPSNFIIYNISKTHGITAPLTLQACGIGFTSITSIPRHIAIWQSNGAIILFDGSTISSISEDIKNLFDANSSDHINFSYSDISSAFFNPVLNEYHWLFADSTSSTINREMVYDIAKHKWYEVDRGTGKKLQCGIPVIDTLGNSYIYGGIATGYLERLEYGTTFDGNNIVSTLKTGDIAFKDWGHQSLLRNIKLLAKAKANTTNTVTITHFKDTETTGTSLGSASLVNTTKRIVQDKFSVNKGDGVFHAFQLQLTTDNEVNALEPIGIQAFIDDIREDK